jgi:hypothetical protein
MLVRRRMGIVGIGVAVGIAVCLGLVGVATAGGRAPKLKAHHAYGGLTAKRDVYVNLRTSSPTVIAPSPANTAPEKLDSNVNFSCPNHAQLNPGMVKIKLKLRRGHYRFSAHFVRKGVRETPPGSGSVTLTVTISGTVKSPKLISGRVRVDGPAGCRVPPQAYKAKLTK